MRLIIDGNNIVKRMYKGTPLLSTASGKHVNTIFGTLRSIKSGIDTFNPQSVHFTWDSQPVVRETIYDGYKKKRRELKAQEELSYTPEQLEDYKQFEIQCHDLTEILPLFGIHQYKGKDVEADDLVAELTRGLEPSVVVSEDQDMLQLVSKTVQVFRPIKDEVYTLTNFESLVELPNPAMYLQARILMGDTSDEIPGVPGFKKGRVYPLIREHKTAEGVLIAAREFVKAHGTKKSVLMTTLAESKQTIVRNSLLMDLKYSSEYLENPVESYKQLGEFNAKEIKRVLLKLEFFSFLRHFENFISAFGTL